MQKSSRLHRKQPGLCLYRVPGTIGFSAKVCAWGKLYWSEPLLRGIDGERERERKPKRERETEDFETQRKLFSLCANWRTDVFVGRNTCSCVSSVVVLHLCMYLKWQWYVWSITANQALFISSVNYLYKGMNYWKLSGSLYICHSSVLFRLLTLGHSQGTISHRLCLTVECHIEFFIAGLQLWLKWKIKESLFGVVRGHCWRCVWL